MDAGRIIERGTHTQLLARQGRYAQMWALQQQGHDVAAADKASRRIEPSTT
jgi:ATP-binding cassette subfamily B protein